MCGGEKKRKKNINKCVDERKRDKEKNKIKNKKLKLRNAIIIFHNIFTINFKWWVVTS